MLACGLSGLPARIDTWAFYDVHAVGYVDINVAKLFFHVVPLLYVETSLARFFYKHFHLF